MSKNHELNGELTAVEAALASLEPGASSIDRDRMMFLAGRASVSVPSPPPTRRTVPWLWPVTTAASICFAIGIGCLFFGSPRVEKQIVYVDVNDGKTEAVAAPKLWYDNVKSETAKIERPHPTPGEEGINYLSSSRLIVAKGVEALPLPKINVLAPIDLSPGKPMTIRDWNMYLNND